MRLSHTCNSLPNQEPGKRTLSSRGRNGRTKPSFSVLQSRSFVFTADTSYFVTWYRYHDTHMYQSAGRDLTGLDLGVAYERRHPPTQLHIALRSPLPSRFETKQFTLPSHWLLSSKWPLRLQAGRVRVPGTTLTETGTTASRHHNLDVAGLLSPGFG